MKPVAIAQQKALKNYLKAYGQDKAKIDALDMSTDTSTIAALLILHGVTLNEYKRASGSGV